MGTGLGPESYAIIEQERIGQLLSSKPHDRRAIIEEAAGITRFKTRKRLSELRLEQAKQNLARVDDIFEEVTRQMGSLKRQAAKAERYAALRDEMRARLRVVLASRITQMDSEQAALTVEIAELGTQIEQGAEQVSALEGEYSSGMARGYQLDSSAKDANARANQASVDLERATTREISNQERIAELQHPRRGRFGGTGAGTASLAGIDRRTRVAPFVSGDSRGRGCRRSGRVKVAPGTSAGGGRSRQRSGTAAGSRTPLRHATAHPGRACAQPDHACGRVFDRAGAGCGAAGRGDPRRQQRSWHRWAQSADRLRSSSSPSPSSCSVSNPSWPPCGRRPRRGAAKRAPPNSTVTACAPKWLR